MSSSSRSLGAAGPLGRRTALVMRSGTVVASAVALMIGATAARGASWQFNPRLELGGTYDDNYLLAEQPESQAAVTGPFIDAQLAILAQTPSSSFELDPEVHSTLYPGNSEDQSTDGYLNVLDSISTPRSQTRLQGSYANQTIAAADLVPATFPGVQLGQPTISGSGVVEQLERQQTIHLFPSTSYAWSPRDHLNFGIDYYRASFDSDVADQVGFQSFGGNVGIAYDATQRSTLSLRGQYSVFAPQGDLPNAEHGGLDGEWDFRETQILTLYVRAGAGITSGKRTGVAGGDISVGDFEGGLGARWTFQVTDVVFDLLRTAVPSSFGILVNENEARLRITHRFTERFAGFVAVRGLNTEEAVSSVAAVPDRNYVTGSTGIEWRITHDFSIDASYTYTWQKYSPAPLQSYAASNAFGLSVVYEPYREKELPQLSTVGGGSPY
ncbi:MAG: hypothetical protein ACREU3_13110 [Steroidobacteraceae bacterium]